MKILRATLHDLDSLSELFDLYRGFYQQKSDLRGAKVFLEKRLINEESIIFIAFEGVDPIGFIQLYPSFSSVSMKKIWVLNDLYVKEKVRGKGFGESLVRKAIVFAEGTDAKGVLLETNQENIAAQTLYKKIGFIEETNHFYFFSV